MLVRRGGAPSDGEIVREVNRILAGAHSVPTDKQLRYVRDQLKKLDEPTRSSVENLVLFGQKLAAEPTLGSRELMYVGLILLASGFLIALLSNTPPLARKMIAIIFALGAGFTAAAIPGALKVRTTWNRMRIDATAGLAAFVIVLYLLWK